MDVIVILLILIIIIAGIVSICWHSFTFKRRINKYFSNENKCSQCHSKNTTLIDSYTDDELSVYSTVLRYKCNECEKYFSNTFM